MKVLQKIGTLASTILNPSSIDSFKATISKHGGLAHTNRFAVIMQPPQQSLLNINIQDQITNLASGESFKWQSLINDPRDLAMLCESVSFPGRRIHTFDYQSVRNNLKVPNGYENEDVTCMFHLTNDYYLKKMFENWQNMIIDFQTYKTGYLRDYASDIVIQQLNHANLPTYGVRLIDAYPTTINSVDLSNLDESTTVRLNVTFSYRDFVPEGSLQTMGSGIKTAVGAFTRLI